MKANKKANKAVRAGKAPVATRKAAVVVPAVQPRVAATLDRSGLGGVPSSLVNGMESAGAGPIDSYGNTTPVTLGPDGVTPVAEGEAASSWATWGSLLLALAVGFLAWWWFDLGIWWSIGIALAVWVLGAWLLA